MIITIVYKAVFLLFVQMGRSNVRNASWSVGVLFPLLVTTSSAAKWTVSMTFGAVCTVTEASNHSQRFISTRTSTKAWSRSPVRFVARLSLIARPETDTIPSTLVENLSLAKRVARFSLITIASKITWEDFIKPKVHLDTRRYMQNPTQSAAERAANRFEIKWTCLGMNLYIRTLQVYVNASIVVSVLCLELLYPTILECTKAKIQRTLVPFAMQVLLILTP